MRPVIFSTGAHRHPHRQIGGFLCLRGSIPPLPPSRTTGSLFNFPATSVPSTFLRALRRLMSGVEFLSVPGLRGTSQNILQYGLQRR